MLSFRCGLLLAFGVMGASAGGLGCSGDSKGEGDTRATPDAPVVIADGAGHSTTVLDAASHVLPPTASDAGNVSPDATNTGANEDAANATPLDAALDASVDATPSTPPDASPLTLVDASADGSSTSDSAAPEEGGASTIGATIASLALANVGEGACSTNSAGGVDFETSCTGNDGLPEYWCADFVQWVWQEAGVDTKGLDAAAGTFYTYGENFGTLHQTPTLGDAVVFNYEGGAYADHVAIVTLVNADGTIETVSGDWNGVGATEAAFSSTSVVFHNTPAYPAIVGSTPGPMGMVLAGFISPAPAGTSPLTGNSVVGAGCYSSTLGKQMPDNACVQSSSDDDWYQCNDGEWAARDSVAWACNGEYPL